MNKRELIAQLAPFGDETEIVACPHVHPGDPCDDVVTVAGNLTREPSTGEIVLHVEFWKTLERGLKALRVVKS